MYQVLQRNVFHRYEPLRIFSLRSVSPLIASLLNSTSFREYYGHKLIDASPHRAPLLRSYLRIFAQRNSTQRLLENIMKQVKLRVSI